MRFMRYNKATTRRGREAGISPPAEGCRVFHSSWPVDYRRPWRVEPFGIFLGIASCSDFSLARLSTFRRAGEKLGRGEYRGYGL